MKILALNGSPVKEGNSKHLINNLFKGAQENGHEVSVIDIYSLEFKGCRACMKCKEPNGRCVILDDMQDIYKEIEKADVIVWASPIYFGQITGELKKVIDRFCMYFSNDFSMRYLDNKKFITLLTSAAPKETFKAAEEYLVYWMEKFFKLENLGSVFIGDLMESGHIKDKEESLKEAYDLGKSI